jgi:hypothetical protein
VGAVLERLLVEKWGGPILDRAPELMGDPMKEGAR